MDLLRIVQLLTYSFGIYAFGSLALYWGRSSCGSVHFLKPDETERRESCSLHSEIVGTAMLWVCFVWFCVALLTTLAALNPNIKANWLRIVQLILMYQFPPLIAQINIVNAQETGQPLRHPAWRVALGALWIGSETILLYALLLIFDVLPRVGSGGALIGWSISGLFAAAAIFSVLASVSARGKKESARERSGRRWMTGLYLLMLALVALIVVAHILRYPFAEVLSFVGSSMPLIFMFTATFHENRFEFFDLFIKRGLLVLATIVLLTAFFGLVLPRLESFELGWARPWVYAIVLLPAVLALPWVYRKLGQWLDNAWLGRQLTSVEAIKHFLSELGCACDRENVIRQAESGLAEIFHAPARINLNLSEAPDLDFQCVLDVPIVSGDERVGVILMGRRENQVPYFSEDIALLGSLADVFSYMLESVELYEKKREQEQVTRALTLQASQSELKALRAQINPHFLFNALNAIAGLIHKDPFRADQTVEQLADIFRYTLRGSESEWAVLEDEMEFVRSYLEIERARFGEKLSVEVTTVPDVASLKIPTMMVQTLVENAVKHGAAQVCGNSRVEVTARRDGGRLIVDVADSGPGFPTDDDDRLNRARLGRKGNGYGLKNVRERLAGHFGDRAELVIHRDEEREMTVISLILPIETLTRTGRGDDAVGTTGSSGVA
jgi:signal transduction histidine kinase